MGVIVDLFLPLALGYIMFCLGLGLTLADFLNVMRRPRDFLVGLACQTAMLPLVALAISSTITIPPELAMGMMLIAAAPGGVTSNLLTYYARGDVALSVSLTAFTSLISAATVPVIIFLSYKHFFGAELGSDVSVLHLARQLFLMATVPVLVGMACRHVAEKQVKKIEPFLLKVATVVFVLVLLAAIFNERGNLTDYFAQAGLLTLILNVSMLTLSLAVARVFVSAPQQQVTISIECGMQSGIVAITLATVFFGGGLFVIPAVTYSLIMYVSAFAVIALFRKKIPMDQSRNPTYESDQF